MKTYSSLSLEVIHFESQDVITASGTPEPIDYGVCVCNPNGGQTCIQANHAYFTYPQGLDGVPYSCTYRGPKHNCE